MRRSGNCATFTHWKLALLFWIGVSEGGQAQAPAATLPPTQTIRGGGGVTRGGGVTMVGTRASFCGLPLGGSPIVGIGVGLRRGEIAVAVDGDALPLRRRRERAAQHFGLVLHRGGLGEVLDLVPVIAELAAASAVACICLPSLVIGPPLTWRHSFTLTGPALSVATRVVTFNGLHCVPLGPCCEDTGIAKVERNRSTSVAVILVRCGSGFGSDDRPRRLEASTVLTSNVSWSGAHRPPLNPRRRPRRHCVLIILAVRLSGVGGKRRVASVILKL